MSEETDHLLSDDIFAIGYEKSVEVMRECCAPDGFLASPTRRYNYRHVWARDGCVIGLAALRLKDPELIDCLRRTLETLSRHLGPHGEVPSNYDPETGRPTYGGTAGRVDADLWFIIGCGQYWRVTGDDAFLRRMREPIENAYFLLGAWEFNGRGLIYVPHTGDWADEYIQSGYVLYDQMLYLQAHREIRTIRRRLRATSDADLEQRTERLARLIRANYWFGNGDEPPKDVYHRILYEQGRKAASRQTGPHWMPFFSPVGYGYRFDAMANALVSLLGVAEPHHRKATDDCIARHIVHDQVMLLPAFHPVITPRDELWDELQVSFSYTFKNKPYEYHNGGLWPLVTGFYAADLAGRGKKELAERYLKGIYRTCSMQMNGQAWSFPEYIHGLNHTPEGTPQQGWSAAAAILAHEAIHDKPPFEF